MRGKPSGSTVREPFTMSPVTNGSKIGVPVDASKTWIPRSYAPIANQVRFSNSHTAGWPVQPMPHQLVVRPPVVDKEHRSPCSGKRQRTSGISGTGPPPYQERVGDPRKVSTPRTVSPQGRPTASGSHQPSYGGTDVIGCTAGAREVVGIVVFDNGTDVVVDV